MGYIWGLLGGLITSLIIAAIPVVWAFYKKQENAGAVLKVSIITFVGGFVLGFVLGLLTAVLSIFGILGSVWSVLSLVITVYIYYCAFANKPFEILEKLGIKL